MRTFEIIAFIVGIACFIFEFYLSSLDVRKIRPNFVALGLAAWILVPLVLVLKNGS